MNLNYTVRTIVIFGKMLLLLKKSSESKNPNSFEFPGGKVDSNALYMNDQVLRKEASRELFEETGIVYQTDQFTKVDYTYEYGFKYNEEKYERKVHFFCAELTAQVNPVVNTYSETGSDNHSGYKWTSLELYENFLRTGSISPNSCIPIALLRNCIKSET